MQQEIESLESLNDQEEKRKAIKKAEYVQLAKQNLAKLQNICSEAGITDLHYENVKFTDVEADLNLKHVTFKENGKFMWVPIDLEVVEQGHKTGLYGMEKDLESQLTSAEKSLIDQFIQSQQQRISRFVPLPTFTFQYLAKDYKTALEIPSKVIETLQKLNYDILDPNELEKFLIESIKNGDIPFFTKKGDVIYYETTEIVIAKRRQ
ncbi:hypothetical protein [Candidatus Protochlamydia sp. R18]|uniref:hypothetical protein n=1 Tax=Candidatus Protochlamydia sp. R18 TaxID=1353977 RepID=UPI000AA3C3CE|nr:hypothetical protein [Candidatus Protochlamydia sp. R18]